MGIGPLEAQKLGVSLMLRSEIEIETSRDVRRGRKGGGDRWVGFKKTDRSSVRSTRTVRPEEKHDLPFWLHHGLGQGARNRLACFPADVLAPTLERKHG